mgnify:CR=1 FL=1
MIKVQIPCKSCETYVTLEAPEESWVAWEKGVFVQNAFPGLTPSERELLISGICGKCFDSLSV